MLAPLQRRRVAAIALEAALALAALFFSQTRSLPPATLAGGLLRFDPQRAMSQTQLLSTAYTRRFTGTPASRRAAAFIARRFRAFGYRVRFQQFRVWYYGRRVVGENVVATLPDAPAAAPYVAMLAHYDSPPGSPSAAEDDASGVGTILELARSTRGRIARPIFVATDAEEIGMIGARQLAMYLRRHGAGAAISIDYVNAGASSGLEATASGQFGGYAPLWLRNLARAAEMQQTSIVRYPYGLDEWIDRAVDRSFQDQGPLLHAGIPAIDLCTIPANRAAAMRRYHTPADVYAGFSRSAFAAMGGSAERLMLTLDRRRYDTGLDGFLVSPVRYIPLDVVWAMQFIALVPLVYAMLLAAGNAGPQLLRTPFAFALPPLAAYALVRLFAVSGIALPRFELYPAPPKDPLLFHVPALVIGAVGAVLVLGYALLLRRRPPRYEKASLFAWTVALLLAAFALQPYGMWLYLGIFGYAALLFIERGGRIAFVINLALCAASALPLAGVLWVYASMMWLGPYVLWYLVLQAAYGVWPFATVTIAIVACVLWVQFVRLAPAKAPAWTRSILRSHRRAAHTSGSTAS